MNNRTQYIIAYAYPTSPVADALDSDNGCWYVKCETRRGDGNWYSAPVIDAFPAPSEDSPYLIQHLALWRASTGPARTLDV